MQILLVLVAVILLFMVIATVVAILFAMLTALAMAAAVGIPLYFIFRHFSTRRGLAKPRISPIERLQNLYIEGKIDLFEYERLVSRLIAVEH